MPLIVAVVVAATSTVLVARSPSTKPSGPVLAAIADRGIRADVKFLADDLLEGRAPSTRGGELASKYIATRFKVLGL